MQLVKKSTFSARIFSRSQVQYLHVCQNCSHAVFAYMHFLRGQALARLCKQDRYVPDDLVEHIVTVFV
jgi:hypothetical protein